MVVRVAPKETRDMDEVAKKLHFDNCDEDDAELNRTQSSKFDLDSSADSEDQKSFNGSYIMDCTDTDVNLNHHSIADETGQKFLEKHKYSPPYKKVRALRLFDEPATPKTLMEKGFIHTPVRALKPSRLSSLLPSTKQPRAYFSDPTANVNPFTPTGMKMIARKRTRSNRSISSEKSPVQLKGLEDSDSECDLPLKRLALNKSNILRYHLEFHELELIGTGEFGSVFKCINRIDGCIYAIKKSNKPVAGCVNERSALNEVWAHAVLQKHPHVVSYYSAWAEENHMVIQMEYCNGGSLADKIIKNQAEAKHFSETELKRILLHIAEGLRYIHSKGLAHLDIKPANIFISKEKRLLALNCDSLDDGFVEDESEEEEIMYKIGDLGHVTTILDSHCEEGDSRYMAKEVMNDHSNLSKADIFSLGLTIYEAGGGGPLPKNGEAWRKIRDGILEPLNFYSKDLNNLLRTLIHPIPENRPTAARLIKEQAACPYDEKSNAQLRRELNAVKLQNEVLSRKLLEANKYLKLFSPNLAANVSNDKPQKMAIRSSSRILGHKVNRSNSLMTF